MTVGSSWRSIGTVVASNTRGPWFESGLWAIFYRTFIYLLSTVLKRRNKEKEVGNGPLKSKWKVEVVIEWVLIMSTDARYRLVDFIREWKPVWPELAIFWTLGNFSKPLATSYLPNSPTFLGIFCKGVKIFKFLVKSFLGNLNRHLAIFSGHTGPGLQLTK